MEKCDVIQWTEDLSVGVYEIDEQHRHFIGIINKLYDSVEKEDVNTDLIGEILKELTDYAELHFATEERYFDEFHYENSEEHKAEHQKLRDDIKSMTEKHELNDISVFTELIAFLNGWFEDHLIVQDKKYTQCFNEHGLH